MAKLEAASGRSKQLSDDSVQLGEVHRNVLDIKDQVGELISKVNESRETQAALKTEVHELRQRTHEIEARQWQSKAGVAGLVVAAGAAAKLLIH